MNPKTLPSLAIGPAIGIAAAAVLSGVLTFIPTWAAYVIVTVVALWVPVVLLGQAKRRKQKASA